MKVESMVLRHFALWEWFRELASADGSARLTTDYRKEVFVPLSSDLARFGSVITIMGDSYSQEDVEMTDLFGPG